MTEAEKPNVYQLIAQVMCVMAKEGIGKDRRNEQQKFSFRGIDDVLNALAPHLSSIGLVILPRVTGRDHGEYATNSGGKIMRVSVTVEYDFVSVHDGSKHTVTTVGEAMDSGDKATNKAMSAAYKYAAIQAFCIPTEGDNDADASTHEVRDTVQGWIDYCLQYKSKPEEFRKACAQARKAIGDARDAQGLKRLTAAIGGGA